MKIRRAAALAPVLLALALGAAGCTEEVEKEIDKLERSTTNNKALNRKVAKIPLGSSVESVKAKLGKPDSYQVSNTSYGKEESFYYGQWQLNFSDGKLESKNRF